MSQIIAQSINQLFSLQLGVLRLGQISRGLLSAFWRPAVIICLVLTVLLSAGAYGVMTSVLAAEEYHIERLAKDLTNIENEIARSQTALLETMRSAPPATSERIGSMEDAGLGVSYVHEGTVVVDALTLTR